MKTKMCYKIIAIMMAICLFIVQNIDIYASNNSMITAAQLGTLLNGMNSIVTQLESLGLSLEEIMGLFELTPRDSSFHTQTQLNVVPYDGSFVIENSVDEDPNPDIVLYTYNGNPPATIEEQNQRIQNIYNISQLYYKTDYYEGNKSNAEAYGKYLSYLYVSYYIDGPGRAPQASDYPYIISSSDIVSYDQFLLNTSMSNWATGVANLGCALASDFNYLQNVNAISSIDNELDFCLRNIGELVPDTYFTSTAVKDITPLVAEYICQHYNNMQTDTILMQNGKIYLSSQLSQMGFYDDYDSSALEAVVTTLFMTLLSLVCGSLTFMGFCLNAIPLLVYDWSRLLEYALLTRLQYSFSARHAIRTGIYLGL